MQKKALVLLVVMVILLVSVQIYIMFLKGHKNIEFDQKTDMDTLITKEYSVDAIQMLNNAVPSKNMTFSDFKKDFDAQCVRKTHQGFYVVLRLKDSRHAYVCFNEDEILYRVLVASNFKSKAEFQSNVTNQMRMSEVREYDSNTLPSWVSVPGITIHIVKEGYFIVNYLRIENGKPSEDPIVSSLEFFENDSLLSDEFDYAKVEAIPYIYEFDKK